VLISITLYVQLIFKNGSLENAGPENTGPQLIKRAKMQRGCLNSMLILGPVDYKIVKALEIIEQLYI